MIADHGLEVVERLRETLAPSGPWQAAHDRGFSWWPSAFSQRVHAGPVELAGGARVWRVRVEMPLLRAVEGGAAGFAVLARWNALRPGLSALRWNGDDRTLSLHASALVRAGDEARAANALAVAALFQMADAARDAQALARELGAVTGESAPPGGVPRTAPDPLVEGWRRVAEHGAGAGPFTRERLDGVAAVDAPPWERVHVDDSGLHAEIACALPGESPAGSAPGAGVALLHLLGSQPHPAYGAGLVAALSLPPEAESVPERAVSTAALLNEAEAREPGDFDTLGAWCVHPQAGLAFVSFWPALLDESGLAERLAREAGRRARWARDFLARAHALRPEPSGS